MSVLSILVRMYQTSCAMVVVARVSIGCECLGLKGVILNLLLAKTENERLLRYSLSESSHPTNRGIFSFAFIHVAGTVRYDVPRPRSLSKKKIQTLRQATFQLGPVRMTSFPVLCPTPSL